MQWKMAVLQSLGLRGCSTFIRYYKAQAMPTDPKSIILQPPPELTTSMLPYWKKIVPNVPQDSDFADAYPLLQPVFETMFNKFEDDKLLRKLASGTLSEYQAQGTLAFYLIIDIIEDESRPKILRGPNGVSVMDRADDTLLLDTAVLTHSFNGPSVMRVSQELALADYMNHRIQEPRGNVANNPVTQRPWSVQEFLTESNRLYQAQF
jgi:hypothetical protein